ncbi:hypothetical protein [Streptomyces bauhiniae]|uniref:hypothetical protein n=1 Tax=Streptomyces bauhiniae TaxID=2340725 RepID=UPI00382B453B
MDHVRMRALAEGLGALAERLEGGWRVEIGPAGPALSLRRRPKRHTGVLRRLRTQLDEQLRTAHPGHICAAPHIAHPSLGRMRHPDAALGPLRPLQGPLRPQGRELTVVRGGEAHPGR